MMDHFITTVLSVLYINTELIIEIINYTTLYGMNDTFNLTHDYVQENKSKKQKCTDLTSEIWR